MMKNLVVLAALFVAGIWMTSASAQSNTQENSYWTNGERLAELCFTKVEGMPENPLCVGYIGGVVDVMANKAEVGGYLACFPFGTTPHTHVTVVKSFLRAHPEQYHYPAALLVAAAISKSFPCKKK